MKFHLNNASIELDTETVDRILKDIVAQSGDDRDDKFCELVKHEPRDWNKSPLGCMPVDEFFHREIIERLAKDSDFTVRKVALENLGYRDIEDE